METPCRPATATQFYLADICGHRLFMYGGCYGLEASPDRTEYTGSMGHIPNKDYDDAERWAAEFNKANPVVCFPEAPRR